MKNNLPGKIMAHFQGGGSIWQIKHGGRVAVGHPTATPKGRGRRHGREAAPERGDVDGRGRRGNLRRRQTAAPRTVLTPLSIVGVQT